MTYDFSNLVTAIQQNDSARVNAYTKKLYEQLMSYLQYSMDANIVDAEDCVQESLITAFRVVRTGQLNDPKSFYSYVKTVCRNNYLNMQNKNKITYLEETFFDLFQAAPQIQDLINKEKTHILIWCFNQLPDKHKDFIRYWYDHPDVKTQKVADLFGISVNNAWTRKHRLIRKLHKCHKKRRNL